jgi:phage shock protein PspC (stress-responsive transcriptional regulator)
MRRLYRSSRDKKIFGVCGGLADYLGVDATLLRILLVVVTVFSGGAVLFVYILAGFIIPREADGFWGGYRSGHYGPGWHGAGPAGHQSPPQYGNQGWPPGNHWPGAGVPPTPPPARPAPSAAQAPETPKPQGLDAMMEDIEKKALRREIEELKAKLDRLEKQSKGE